MAQITSSTSVTDMENDKEKFRYIQLFLQSCQSVVNGRLDFGNFNAKIQTVSFSSANADTTIDHGLGRRPAYYLTLGLSASMVIYDGTIPATSSQIVLKSSAVGSARILFL